MSELANYQKMIFRNKVEKNFNTTNIEKEFLMLYGEVSEAFDAYKKNNKAELAEELADVAIYLLGLSEILNIDLDQEIQRKIEINHHRKYQSNGNGYGQRIDD